MFLVSIRQLSEGCTCHIQGISSRASNETLHQRRLMRRNDKAFKPWKTGMNMKSKWMDILKLRKAVNPKIIYLQHKMFILFYNNSKMFISILTNMLELKELWGKNCCKLYTAILEKHKQTGFDTCAFLFSRILATLCLCKIPGTWQLRTRKNWQRIVSIRPISWWFTSATLQFRGEKVSLKHENSMFEGEGIEWYTAKWRIDAIIFPWHWSKHNLFYLHPSAMEISVKDFLKQVETLRSTYPTNPI